MLWNLLLASSLTVHSAHSVSAETFNSAECSQDWPDKVVVRLTSGLAFGLPPEMVEQETWEQSATAEREEPPGCPGNPLQDLTFYVGFQYMDFSAEESDILESAGLSGVRIIGNNLARSFHEYHLTQFSATAERTGNCTVTSERIAVCYTCRADPDRPHLCEAKADAGISSDGRAVTRAGFYARDPENPTGPEGLPWTAFCIPEMLSGSRFCNVTYNIQDGLSLSYQFGQGGSGRMDINAMRALDQTLRQGILSLRTPEFDGKH